MLPYVLAPTFIQSISLIHPTFHLSLYEATVDTYQALVAGLRDDAWSHQATIAWAPYPRALLYYALTVVDRMDDSTANLAHALKRNPRWTKQRLKALLDVDRKIAAPPWLKDPVVHFTHQRCMAAKADRWYAPDATPRIYVQPDKIPPALPCPLWPAPQSPKLSKKQLDERHILVHSLEKLT